MANRRPAAPPAPAAATGPKLRQTQAEYTAACAVQKNHFDPAEFPYDLNPDGGASNHDPAAIAHMRAQVHNPADGWDETLLGLMEIAGVKTVELA